MVGIYRITNLVTNDCYIGQSKHIEKRWKQHFQRGYGAQHSDLFQSHIDEYGIEGFRMDVLEECRHDELRERERHYLTAIRPSYNTIYPGHAVSAETRDKIRWKLVGRPLSEETCRKISAAIRKKNAIRPQTNAGHRKRCAADGVEFESVGAAADYFGVKPCTVTKALKRKGKVRGHKVWYIV